MKKVLFMAKAFGGGGAEVAMLGVGINKMPEEQYDITLALLDDDLEYFGRLNRKIKIVQIQFKNSVVAKMVSMYSIPAKILKEISNK